MTPELMRKYLQSRLADLRTQSLTELRDSGIDSVEQQYCQYVNNILLHSSILIDMCLEGKERFIGNSTIE